MKMAKDNSTTICYDKLWHMLIDKHMSKNELRLATGLSSGTFAKLSRNELLTTASLIKICDILKCDIGDIVTYVPDENKTNQVKG